MYDSSGNPITVMRFRGGGGGFRGGNGSGTDIVAIDWFKGSSAAVSYQTQTPAVSAATSSLPTPNSAHNVSVPPPSQTSSSLAGSGSVLPNASPQTSSLPPVLAIAFAGGKVHLMRSESDSNPIILDTGHQITKISWNPDGTTLAVAGSIRLNTDSNNSSNNNTNVVEFYNSFGVHLRTLRVPGSGSVNAITWEGDGLRIALAIDSFIYFANIRMKYNWAYFSNTLVYAYRKPERSDDCVMFWDTRFGEKYAKYVKNLIRISACGEFCALVTKGEEPEQIIVILCNAIGSPIDSRYRSLSSA